MMTMKQLLTSTVSSSPDGKHWEPSLPMPWTPAFRDAWEVLRGRAVAVRQTTKADLEQL